MDVFANTNAAPFTPSKTPYKSTTIRIPKNDDQLARQPRSDLLCTVCDNPGPLKCSGCHSMRYCSEGCQRADRETHKFFCKSFKRFTDDKRPSPHHIRAILFPEHKSKPEWKWVLRNDDRTAVCLSHMYERLETDGLTESTPVMSMSCTIERMSRHWLFSLLLYQDTRGESTSIINQSISNLGPPGHLMDYWGPMLVVGGTPEMSPSAQYPEYPMINLLEDVTMNDTSFVIEAVLYGDHQSPCVVDVPRYSRYWKSLPALKVNCLGDRWRLHPEKDPFPPNYGKYEATAIYEPVTVPNKQELSPKWQYPCILPFLLGLPWLCRRVANSFPECQETTLGRFVMSKHSNDQLGSVHANLLEHGSGLIGVRREMDPMCAANLEMSSPPGTLILVHVFGEPILMEHLKVFDLFYDEANLKDWWRPGCGWKKFNRELFQKFWADKQRDNNMQGIGNRCFDLANIPSPYAWLEKPRQEDKYVKGFAQYERLLTDTVTDVYFDNVFRGGRPNPWAGGSRDWSQYFDPLN